MTIRPAPTGSPVITPTQGGVIRRLAPADGMVIDLEDRDVFVDAHEAALALIALGWTVIKPGVSRG